MYMKLQPWINNGYCKYHTSKLCVVLSLRVQLIGLYRYATVEIIIHSALMTFLCSCILSATDLHNINNLVLR